MRKLAFLLFVPLLFKAADLPARPDAIVAMTRTVPGEFAADALIRLAALDSFDKPRKIELLELAFQRAGEAQEPLKRQPAILKVPGAVNFLQRAFSQNLDAISLRLRAVDALEKIDPARARTLFQQTPTLHLPKLACSNFMAYDPAPYYQALARLASPAQSVKQLEAMSSPTEIAPAIQLVLASPSDAAFRDRLSAFSGALRKISGDDRSFTFAGDLGPHILTLVDAAKHRAISHLPLLEAYRLYLVTNEQTSRCADDDMVAGAGQPAAPVSGGESMIGGEGMAFFNEKLRAAPLAPIQEVEVTPTALEGVAEGMRGCTATACEAIAGRYNALIFDPEKHMAYPPAVKTTPEWQDKVRQFLSALAEWKSSSAVTPAQYYRQKSASYADTLSLVPSGPLQGEVVKALVQFAQNNEFARESRIEWFLPVNILIGRMALDPLGPGRFAAYARESTDPVIALYSALETAAPRSPDQIMPLM